MKTTALASLMFLIFLCVSATSSELPPKEDLFNPRNTPYPVRVKNLSGLFRHGQVFLTWTNASNSDNHYKVYRSLIPISHGWQLSQSEYLGYTTQISAEDIDLTLHFGTPMYLTIDSGGNPLPSTVGLFVATTLQEGNYFYAVTVELNGVEDTAIFSGLNSTTLPIAEQIMPPQPVFQKSYLINNKNVELYTSFFSFKTTTFAPPILTAGFIASDFLLFRNTNQSANQPLSIQMHGGGEDFFNNITLVSKNEMNLDFESNFPSGEDAYNWGANSNHDIYQITGNVPASGTNYNFFQQMYERTVKWIIKNFNVDSNRIYLTGTSAGACGAFVYALTYPDRFAAVKLGVPSFNVGFQNDSVPISSLNTGMPNRKKIDQLLGLVSTNLPSNFGTGTFDLLNGEWKVHQARNKDFPFIYAINGKNDLLVGWTEKTVYYDSVNANAPGGYYFWDGRTHGGDGSFWAPGQFDLFRFKKNVSYPAFSNCSLNEDFGNGAPTSGAAHGTVNGTLDWVDPIVDSSRYWEINFFIRDLKSINGQIVSYDDSATVDITPRRLQQFHVPLNTKFYLRVTHHSKIIQSSSKTYTGGAITLRGIKVFKDTVKLRIWYLVTDSSQIDADGDSYTPAQGDCNDHNPDVHPGAADICNGIDDNCDGTTDENAIVATISPSDDVSVCKGTALILIANSGSGINYQWLENGTPISGATNQTYTPTQSGLYAVSETNLFSCSSASASTSVTFLNLPPATITPLGDLDICETGSVDLQANTGNMFTYQWKKGSNNISGATNQVYTATTPGTYKVIVTNKNDCRRTSAGIKVTKSCKENGDEIMSVFTIYPNPAEGKFNLRFQSTIFENSAAKVEVVSLLGQVMYVQLFSLDNGWLQAEIQGGFEEGVYLVKVISNDRTLEKKLVISK